MNLHAFVALWVAAILMAVLEAAPKPLGPPNAALPIVNGEFRSCAERCAEDFVKMVADHPDYSSYQQKDESLKCIHQCRGSKKFEIANKKK